MNSKQFTPNPTEEQAKKIAAFESGLRFLYRDPELRVLPPNSCRVGKPREFVVVNGRGKWLLWGKTLRELDDAVRDACIQAAADQDRTAQAEESK